MNSRDITLLELRGETIGIVNSQSSSEELFQNKTPLPVFYEAKLERCQWHPKIKH